PGIHSVFKTDPDRSIEQVPPGNPRHPPLAGAQRQTDEDHQICLHDPGRNTTAGLCIVCRSPGQYHARLSPLSRKSTPRGIRVRGNSDSHAGSKKIVGSISATTTPSLYAIWFYA